MNKTLIENQHFTGERALFKTNDAEIRNCLFDNGESPLKESKSLHIEGCTFGYKYPLWYGEDFEVKNSTFLELARAGIWYTNNSSFKHLNIDAPKQFRHCKGIVIEDVAFSKAEETLWWCDNVTFKNVKATGNYLFMQSKNILVSGLELNGDYAFDGVENLTVRESILHTKDAFWNAKNVLVENSTIEGEYFGWNAENVTLKNCKIKSHQGFCYMKGVTLINCEVEGDLIFEYCSDIHAEITTSVDSIKNPFSGEIKVKEVKDLIFDDPKIDPSKTIIEVSK